MILGHAAPALHAHIVSKRDAQDPAEFSASVLASIVRTATAARVPFQAAMRACAAESLRVLDAAPQPLRDCVGYAAAESRLLGHGYIGSEHLLLGLLRMDGSRAAQLLTQAGVAHDRVASAVTRIVGVGERLPSDAQLPFTPRSARVAQRVVGEGERLGHDAIGSEHVLRALLRAGDGVAFRVLGDLGVDVSDMAKGLRKPQPDF